MSTMSEKIEELKKVIEEKGGTLIVFADDNENQSLIATGKKSHLACGFLKLQAKSLDVFKIKVKDEPNEN